MSIHKLFIYNFKFTVHSVRISKGHTPFQPGDTLAGWWVLYVVLYQHMVFIYGNDTWVNIIGLKVVHHKALGGHGLEQMRQREK